MKNASMNGIFSRNVEIFISLAKTKSFQKTASIFGLSTSSISKGYTRRSFLPSFDIDS